MLSTHQLEVRAGSKRLFESLDLAFQPGTLTSIVGENGIGKSSLLGCLTGLIKPAKGQVRLGANDLYSLSPVERARRIASLGQEERCPGDLLVESRIAQGLVPRRGPQALLDRKTLEHIESLSEELELTPFLGRRLGSLSGGEKKRVHIARALVDSGAEAYVLDEPEASLDRRHRQTLMKVLQARRDEGKIVIITVHDRELANEHGDRTLRLNNYESLFLS